jgi:hypothetical protein
VRLLVVGAYPPPSGAEERQTMATVRRLANDGDEIEVLAQAGSAAHHLGAITGTAGAFDAWRRARAYDGVVLQVGTRVPLRTFPGIRGRVARLLDCLAWGLVLRASKGSRIVAPDLDAIPGSIGGRTGRFLWSSAARVVVASELGKQRLIAAACCPPERIDVVSTHGGPHARWDKGWERVTDQATAEELIVERATRDRRAALRARSPRSDGPAPAR